MLQWMAGASVLLGVQDAVSGASTTIVSATTARATNGLSFKYRILTSPYLANTYSMTALPPHSALPKGLKLVNSPLGTLTGIPTEEGTWQIQMMASDSGRPDRTTYATLTLTILPNPNVPPTILSQPKSLTVTNGDPAQFSVVSSRNGTIQYQWFFAGAALTNATQSLLTLTNVDSSMAGDYQVVVRNNSGSVTSDVATLTVVGSAVVPISLGSPTSLESLLSIPIQGPIGATVILWSSSDFVQWTPISTNLLDTGSRSLSDRLDIQNPALFYRATLQP